MAFFMAMALVGVCFGAVYKVGDSHGWTDQGHFNYKTWSSNKHFTVGDTLVFEYDAKKENLVQVDHKGYKECKAKDPLFTFASGNDNVKITMPGDFFYISSLHDHCTAGQKLHIQVHASSSTPSQTPSFSSPSPSPVHLSPSPTPVATAPVTSTPSGSPSLSPNGYPMPSPSGSPSYNLNRSPRTITRPPPNPSPTVRPNPPKVRPNPPTVRPNPPPSVPKVVSNPPPSVPIVVSHPPPSPGGTPPKRRKAVITESQASPSNGLPILQVLMAVAVVACIA